MVGTQAQKCQEEGKVLNTLLYVVIEWYTFYKNRVVIKIESFLSFLKLSLRIWMIISEKKVPNNQLDPEAYP